MIRRNLAAAGALCGMLLAGVQFGWAQSDVTQPGDAIFASSANSPGSEGAANAIDNQPTKYLNFDGGRDGAVGGFSPSGFAVTPGVGKTIVTAIGIQSANDGPERDPQSMLLEGSNDESITDYSSGNWETIVQIDGITAWTDRFELRTFEFENNTPYRHYRWTVLATQTTPNGCCMQVAEVELLGKVLPSDVTQPGDAIFASSANSPGSEGAANAIDNQPTKYLNFDGGRDGAVAGFSPSGFAVTPVIGRTLVTGLTMQSANDAPERDPLSILLEGSNDETISDYSSGNWETIIQIDDIPAYPERFQTQTFVFDNFMPYLHYRWTVLATQTTPNGCCMQIAEVELLGTGAPQDVTQPGDPIFASSANSPGSEGAANAIDNQPTKYLNFDSGRDGAVAGFSPSGFAVTPSVGVTTVIGLAIESANDGPERDPLSMLLEGSNDDTITDYSSGNWEVIVQIDEIAAWTERFQVREFYFPNDTAYKHYRWTVLETQTTPNGCCMQVAEVEFLAATDQADCEKAAFVRLPQNSPVLSGQAATFFTVVNGPWPLQWYKNGERIPGATQLTYTTEAITTANEADEYTVEIVGCQVSDPVKAQVFVPSTFKSIGVSFDGGGANGAPTAMQSTDIAGIHLQAYWNNATNITHPTPNAPATNGPLALVDSDNQASAVTVTFASSGEWGAGTGDISPRQRMLNGLIYDNQGGEPGRITFANVPAGEHDILVYTVGIPLQFQDQDYTVIGSTTRSIYTRQMNADQYNPNPIWVRGNSADPNLRTLANYVRFQKVQPAGDGTIALTWTTPTVGFDRGVAVNGIQLVLNAPDVPEPPQLVALPEPTETLSGGTVTLSVDATGEGLTYQWRKNGVLLSDGGRISGSKGPELSIRSFGAADEGFYDVVLENEGGSAITDAVKVKIVDADRTIADSLIAHFKMDETSGTTVDNSGSDAIDGAMIFTAPNWGPGKIGNAYEESSGNDGILVPNYTKIQEEATVSAWVRINSIGNTDYQIIRNASGNLSVAPPRGQFEFDLDFVSATVMNLRARITAGPNITSVRETTAFPVGEWQHVAFTVDGHQMRLYRNGALVGSSSYLDPINQPTVEWLSIGARMITDTAGGIDVDSAGLPPDAGPQVLVGQIDDVGIWTFAWPASVIQSIYEQGNAGQDLTTAQLPDLPLPPTEITLSVSMATDGSITIGWAPEGGTLETTTNIGDPGSWTPVAGNPNPYSTPAAGSAYFRVTTE